MVRKLGRRSKRKRLSAEHKAKISRSLKGRTSPSRSRLSNLETASKVVRNLSLAAETPSKIARNTSLTKATLSRLSFGVDRNLDRVSKGSRSLDNFGRTLRRLG
jgi:DNA invertase Pin-like site-specific DNA recombinase